jgi:hypothetical protein
MMQKTQDWLKKDAKTNAVGVSIKKINSSLGDYLSAIKALNRVGKEMKQSR